MKELIASVQEYFTGKLLAGDFEVEEITQHTIEISIDGYIFTFWIANEDYGFTQYSDFDRMNFIDLDLKGKDLNQIWKSIKAEVEEYKNDVLRKEKLKQFNELKAELKIE